MQITGVIPQLRTTDLEASIEFYTQKLGFTLDFRYEDFYAGIRSGDFPVHLKSVDVPDPSIAFVSEGEHLHLYFVTVDVDGVAATLKARGVELVREVHETPWGTRELIVRDNAGHTLRFGEQR